MYRESRVLLRNVINKRAKVTFSRQIRTSHFSREWIYIYRLSDTDAELTNERRNEKEKIVERGRKKKFRVPSYVSVKARSRNETFIEENPRPV